MLKRLVLSCLIASFSLLLGGCGGVHQNRAIELANSLSTSPVSHLNREIALLPSPGHGEPQDPEIRPEDLVEVTLFNIDPKRDGLPGKINSEVNHTGFVTFPLLGRVKVSGLTAAELEQALREKYGLFMYEPDVKVQVDHHGHVVSVLGAVGNPNKFELHGDHKTLREVLALAGGVKAEAGIFVHVVRKVTEAEHHVSQQGTERENMYVINLFGPAGNVSAELNFPIHPGDVINVPFAGMFFVDGYVHRPGGFSMDRPYTLTQALTLAGGVDFDAKSSDITIFRANEAGDVQALKVDLGEIQALEAENIRIVENDVIVVPGHIVKIIISRLIGAVGFTMRQNENLGYTFGGINTRGVTR